MKTASTHHNRSITSVIQHARMNPSFQRTPCLEGVTQSIICARDVTCRRFAKHIGSADRETRHRKILSEQASNAPDCN